MQRYPNEVEVRVKFVADTSDIDKKLGKIEKEAVTGGGAARGGGAGGVRVSAQKTAPKGQESDILKHLKPLAKLVPIAVGIGTMVANSQLIKTYVGAFGKIMGATVDMILAPFMPFINLAMMALMKIVQFLITSGILGKIHSLVIEVVDYFKNIYNTFKKEGIAGAIKQAFKGAFDSLGGAIGGLGMMVAGGILGGKMLGMVGGRMGASSVVGGKMGMIAGGMKGAAGGLGGGMLGMAASSFMGADTPMWQRAGVGALTGAGMGFMLGGGLPGAIIGGLVGGIGSFLAGDRHSPSPLEEALTSVVERTGLNVGGARAAPNVVTNQRIEFNIPLQEKVSEDTISKYFGNEMDRLARRL